MSRGIAYRRFQEQKKKKEVEKWCSWHDGDKRIIGIIAKTPRSCSCAICGNPRKHYGERTYQELLFEEEYKQSLKDFQGVKDVSSVPATMTVVVTVVS